MPAAYHDHRSRLRRRRRRRRRRRVCARRSGMTVEGLKTACITKVFPTRSHTVAAQGGIGAALGNMGEDDWRWHMYDTVKGSDWLGDQDAIEYMCRNAIPAVIELEHFGVPFSRTEDGQDLPAAVRRPHDGLRRGRAGQARLRRRRPHRPRDHPHALSAMRCSNNAEFFVEYFALDLIMDDEGACRGVMAWNLEDGTHPPLPRAYGGPGDRRLRPHLFLLHLGAYLHRRRQRHGAARRAAAAGHGVHPVPPDRHLRRRLPDHRGRARRGRLSHQQRGRALHGALRAARQGPGLARRGQPRDDDRDPRGPRLRPATRTTSCCISSISTPRCCTSGCPASPRRRKIFAGVDVTREPIPVLPTVHYNMGGIPTNYHGEVLRPTDDDPDAVVPGPDGDRRGGLRLGARRQPARLQLAARSRRVRPRRGASRRRAGAPGHAARAADRRRRRGGGRPARRGAPRQGPAQDRRDPPRDAARRCRTTAPCSAPPRCCEEGVEQDRRGGRASFATSASPTAR